MICPNCNKEVVMQPECNINGLDQVRCPKCGITYSQIPLKDNTNWNSIRTQAAIAAMQAQIQAYYTNNGIGPDPNLCSKDWVKYADALIAELKKRE